MGSSPTTGTSIDHQRLTSSNSFKNTQSFNKSFNTSPRVFAVLSVSHHAETGGDRAVSLPAVAMLIPQLEGVPLRFFKA